MLGEHYRHSHLTWHDHCLSTHRVASGQKPERTQITICQMCAGPAEDLDDRLGIAAAKALEPDTLRHALTIENLRRLCHDCHRSMLVRRTGRYLKPNSLDWCGALRVRILNRTWAGASLRLMDAGGDVQPLRNVRTAA